MTLTVFDQIRQGCQWVAGNATHVKINHERISDYADSLSLEKIKQPELHPERHYLDQGADTLAYFLTVDAINFGSGYFPHLRKRPGMSGYFTVASSLNDYFKANGPLTAEQLATITTEDCTQIFGQDPENTTVQELMGLFRQALNDLGNRLQSEYEGSFTALVEAADHSAARLVELLSEMPLYRDVQVYRGREVPFYKRAQLTVADLNLSLKNEPWGRFDDLDQLTIFADNLVPHVLRMDGILSYEEDLLERIYAEALITPGSEEEVEIRACALYAVELMADHFRKKGTPATALEIDYLLWTEGQLPQYKKDHPRHRARTVFY